MQIFHEFKTFIARGNVLDLAIGVIIGAAFKDIIDSLVKDVITPPIGALVSRVDFSQLAWRIGGTVEKPVVISYGKFLQASVNFLIIATVIFLVVKALNALKRRQENEPASAPPPPPEVALLAEIRDLLKTSPRAVVAPVTSSASVS